MLLSFCMKTDSKICEMVRQIGGPGWFVFLKNIDLTFW